MRKLHQVTAEKTYIFDGKKDEKDHKIKRPHILVRRRRRKQNPSASLNKIKPSCTSS